MAISAICQAAIALNLPSLPFMPEALHTSPAMVQLTLSAFLASFALFQLFAGPLSDRLGRRKVMLGGMLLLVAASAFAALAPDIEWLILARVLQGIGACCAVVLARAVVRDLAVGPAAAHGYAMLATAAALAPAIAPLLGGQLHRWFGWPGGFYALTVAGALAWVAMWLRLPTTGGDSHGRFFNGYGELLRHRRFMAYSAGTAFLFAMFYCFIGKAPALFIVTLRLPLEYFGFVTLMWAGAFILGAQTMVRLSVRIPPVRFVLGGALLSVLASLGMLAANLALPASLPSAILPLFLIGFGAGLSMPTGSALALGEIPARIAGTASATMGFMQIGLGALVSSAMGLLPDGAAWLAASLAFFAVLAWLASLAARSGRATP
jgi:DHA1 family bicyclomycin/chloramphenicol resistance-like MFS transporter